MSLLISCYALIILFYVCNFLVEALWDIFQTQFISQKGERSYHTIVLFSMFIKMIRFVVICGMSLLLSAVCDFKLNRSGDQDAVMEDFMGYNIIDFDGRDFENGDIEMQ
jgi:hypothetical protein